MIRIDPHTQWTRHRIRLVGRLRCYRFTSHYSNQLYHHYNFYTDTEFQWVWLAFVTFPFLTRVRYPLHRRSIHYSLGTPTNTPWSQHRSRRPEHHLGKTASWVWLGEDTSLRSASCTYTNLPLPWTDWGEVWWVWLSGTYRLPSHIPSHQPNRTFFP